MQTQKSTLQLAESSRKIYRKEKSLGELCKKFVYLYSTNHQQVISLNSASESLGIERRRIYDIINILESFNIVTRLKKNTYNWQGLYEVPLTISRLKNSEDVNFRKDKSLGLLCLNFIKLFIKLGPVVSLKQAAVAISNSEDEQLIKTKIRRLYDIANVLCFMKLAKKTNLGAKPAYEWRGVEGFQEFMAHLPFKFQRGCQIWAPNQKVSTPMFDRLMHDLLFSKREVYGIRVPEVAGVQQCQSNILRNLSSFQFFRLKGLTDVFKNCQMARREIEAILLELFTQVYTFEHQVEQSRQTLAENPNFTVTSIFKFLDQNNKGYITARDFQEFFDSQKFYTTEKECSAIVMQYDSNNDQRLSMNEVQQLFLPSTDLRIREAALARYSGRGLSQQIVYPLSRLLEKELAYHRQIEKLRQGLFGLSGFSIRQALSLLDYSASGKVTRDDIKQLFSRSYKSIFEEDIDAILRRFDIDGDSQLNYTELSTNLQPLNPPPLKQTRSSAELYRSSSPLRKPQPEDSFRAVQSGFNSSRSQYLSPPDQSFTTDRSRYETVASPRLSYRLSPAHQSNNSFAGSQRFYQPRSRSRQYLAVPDSSFQSRLPRERSPSRLQPKDEADLVGVFRTQIENHRNLENAKTELAIRPDFNLYDIYSLFDIGSKNYVSISDFEQVLQDLRIYPQREEVYLLFKHYGKNSTHSLRFSEFSQLFEPRDPGYANILRNRQATSYTPRVRSDAFTLQTKDALTKVLKLLLQSESVSESLRHKLSIRSPYSIVDAFEAIDQDRNGVLTPDEFESLLNSFGIYPKPRELQALIEVYDRNRDGKVTYSEFVQAVTPRSPRRY